LSTSLKYKSQVQVSSTSIKYKTQLQDSSTCLKGQMHFFSLQIIMKKCFFYFLKKNLP